MTVFWALAIGSLVVLLYFGRSKLAWLVPLAIVLGGWWSEGGATSGAFLPVLIASVVVATFLAIPALRWRTLGRALLKPYSRALPRLGDTERIALEAGTVWWDGELFSGRPNWQQLLDFQVADLSEDERAFLDGPVNDLCRKLDDWAVFQQRDLPPEVWADIKSSGLLGMIVPKKYGGLEFSAQAQSLIVTRLASRSITAAVTVMVPNSLGPAELLLHYGTDEQKNHYLPRLASGEELPCFALTGPEAGSDAAATQSVGIVCRGEWEGRDVLGMRLTWRKRYITLAPVATLIGLAFRLKDPEGLLGEVEDLGITCALIPRSTPGVNIGQRHDPMGIPFHNGPTTGDNVFVPLDFIIGGPERAGQGWRMLMESLAAGRSISLPALSVGAAQLATRLVGAYGTVREQFDTPIGRFEGVEEPLAFIGGMTYVMNAARWLTCGALDAGHQPAVISAIVKAYLTNGMRDVLSHAMDIRAGAAIIRGPRNVLSRAYCAVPIGITVEGANILTRSMIIYGQGAIRCHPFVQKQIEAVAANDVRALDAALFGHVGFAFTNCVRSFLLALGAWRLEPVAVDGPAARYLKRLNRISAAFAWTSDIVMVTYGGRLKRKEKVSGRLADVLAWMYLASAAVRKFEHDGQPPADAAAFRWAVEHALDEALGALYSLVRNLPAVPRWLLRITLFPLGRSHLAPNDALGAQVARGLLEDRASRTNLTRDIFLPGPDEVGLGSMEAALDAAVEAIPVETKLRDAVRAGLLDRAPGDALALSGLEAGIITDEEYRRLLAADLCRSEVIQVDAFDPEDYLRQR